MNPPPDLEATITRTLGLAERAVDPTALPADLRTRVGRGISRRDRRKRLLLATAGVGAVAAAASLAVGLVGADDTPTAQDPPTTQGDAPPCDSSLQMTEVVPGPGTPTGALMVTVVLRNTGAEACSLTGNLTLAVEGRTTTTSDPLGDGEPLELVIEPERYAAISATWANACDGGRHSVQLQLADGSAAMAPVGRAGLPSPRCNDPSSPATLSVYNVALADVQDGPTEG